MPSWLQNSQRSQPAPDGQRATHKPAPIPIGFTHFSINSYNPLPARLSFFCSTSSSQTSEGNWLGGVMATTPDLAPPDIGPRPRRDSSSKTVSLKRLRKAFIARRSCSFRAALADSGSGVNSDTIRFLREVIQMLLEPPTIQARQLHVVVYDTGLPLISHHRLAPLLPINPFRQGGIYIYVSLQIQTPAAAQHPFWQKGCTRVTLLKPCF